MEVFQSFSCAPQFEVIKGKNFTKHPPNDPVLDGRLSTSTPGSCAGSLRRDSRTDRTIFVGNIPVKCTKKNIKHLFKQYGSVESIRFRSLKISQSDRPPTLAKRTQKMEGNSFNAYIVMSSREEAEKCLNLNGMLLQGRHLRIDLAEDSKDAIKTRRSVFVGNLPFSVDEEKLRETFVPCGEIENVRIVRDPTSGIGKGFGFITFKDKSGVIFALKQNNKVMLDARVLRVHKCKDQDTIKKEKQSKISGLKYHVKLKDKPMKVTKIVGKRRQDGTKNRYYRLPANNK